MPWPSSRRWGPVLLAGALVLPSLGCAGGKGRRKNQEFAELGTANANSEPPPGIFDPVGAGDLEGIQARGRLLFDLERVLRLGYEQGVFKVGLPEGDVVLPLADVDPGGKSGQVVFLRWPRGSSGPDGELDLAAAQRWLMVPVLLDPDRALDVEVLRGPVAPGGDEYVRAEAMLEAARVLRVRAPGEVFHLFALHERVPAEGKRGAPIGQKLVTRVYAMSAEGDGPDLEIVVDAPRRKKPPEVLETVVVHRRPVDGHDPIVLDLDQPAPATVARILARGGGEGVEVGVRTRGGSWRISAADGRVVRAAGAAAHSEAPSEAPSDGPSVPEPAPGG